MPLCSQAHVVCTSPCIATEACECMLIGYYSKGMEILSWLYCPSKEIHILQKEICLTHTDSSWPGPWMLVSRSVPMGYDLQFRKNDCILPDGATGLIIIANSDLPPSPEFNWITPQNLSNKCTQDLGTISWLTLGKLQRKWAYECPGHWNVTVHTGSQLGTEGNFKTKTGIMFSDPNVVAAPF